MQNNKIIYFIGIAGSGISSLAHICLDLGFTVYGHDDCANQILDNLVGRGVKIINPDEMQGLDINLDYLIFTSAVQIKDYDNIPAKQRGKRDLLINDLIKDYQLDLIAVAGTHGKTTTSSMLVWLFKQAEIPISYVVGSTLSFANSGGFAKNSKYLILEADEYDRHFLNYHPQYSLITNIEYDHPDIYPNEENYLEAFIKFINQSKKTYLHTDTEKKILKKAYLTSTNYKLSGDFDSHLAGKVMRENANLALSLFEDIFPKLNALKLLARFPGADRRSQLLAERIFSDYAHHPTEIKATVNILKERYPEKNLIVVYRPHQNLRQIMVKELYSGAFDGVDKLFWLETYLSREGDKEVLPAKELAKFADHPNTVISTPGNKLISDLKNLYKDSNNIIVLMTAGEDAWFLSAIPTITGTE